VKLVGRLLDRIAERIPLDEDIFSLPQPMYPPCCLHFNCRVEHRLHEEDARRCRERDAYRSSLVRHDEELGARRRAVLELGDPPVAYRRLCGLVELIDLERWRLRIVQSPARGLGLLCADLHKALLDLIESCEDDRAEVGLSFT